MKNQGIMCSKICTSRAWQVCEDEQLVWAWLQYMALTRNHPL